MRHPPPNLHQFGKSGQLRMPEATGPWLSVIRCFTLNTVRIGTIAHKGLRRRYDEDSTKGIPAVAADKLHNYVRLP